MMAGPEAKGDGALFSAGSFELIWINTKESRKCSRRHQNVPRETFLERKSKWVLFHVEQKLVWTPTDAVLKRSNRENHKLLPQNHKSFPPICGFVALSEAHENIVPKPLHDRACRIFAILAQKAFHSLLRFSTVQAAGIE